MRRRVFKSSHCYSVLRKFNLVNRGANFSRLKLRDMIRRSGHQERSQLRREQTTRWIEFWILILGSFFKSHWFHDVFFVIVELKKSVHMSNNKITDMKTSIIISVIDATRSSSCEIRAWKNSGLNGIRTVRLVRVFWRFISVCVYWT